MKKKKYIIIALVWGICVTACSGTIVLAAQEQAAKENENSDVYTEMGDSEEERAYRKFLENGDDFSDVKQLSDVMYAVYDINKDKKKELILRGRTSSEGKDEYFFYRYKDKEVETIGSMENWQNGGNGELYYVEKGNGIVVYTQLADRKSYSLYQVESRIKCNFVINRRSIDVKGKDGKDYKEYAYNLRDENGNLIGKNITQKDWDEFESALVEIPFYNIKMTSDSQFSEEQIDTLKKSLGVPDEENVTKFIAGDPWYWEGAGLWIVSIEMYDKDGIFLAGAAIDPDTLELQREIAPYSAERVAQARTEKGIDDDPDESLDMGFQEVDKISDAVEIAGKAKGLKYSGGRVYNLRLQRDENNHSVLYPEMESGILVAFSMDFDGDGDEEIFSVSYDSSGQDGLGRVLHFLFLEKDEESWKITSDQEVITRSSYGEMIDRNCLDGRCVKEEDSVFFRKYNGAYEFFYEEYDAGIIADGQEWFFKGFRLENGELKIIDETNDLYFTGSSINQLWENFEGGYSNELEKFSFLGFASPTVYFENMTVDSNDCLYGILRMIRDTSCSPEIINQWMSNNSQETLDGFTCTIENQTEEIPENIEEFQTKAGYQSDGFSMDAQIVSEADDDEKTNENVSENIENEQSDDTTTQQSGNTSFYGIWCYGSKGEEESISYAETLKNSGFDAKVFVTTDWSNLNTEKFYVVTAGIYATEDEANSALASVQSVCSEAYVKYSGDFQG